MRGLKIGFVLDDTLDSADGVQQYILTLGAWLVNNGHEVHYLVGNTRRTDISHIHSLSRNVSTRFNGNRMSTPLPGRAKDIRRLLTDEKFDILHVQMPYSPFMARQVILAAPAKTIVFGTFHIAPQSGLVRKANQALGLLLRPSLKRFDHVVSVSRAAAEFAEQTFGITSEIVPNVVEAARFQSAAAFPQYKDVPTVVFVGRLVPRKGCQVLLEALVEMRRETPVPDLRVVICGRGPLEAELKAYASAHGLADMVEFTGFVTEEDKARYLKSADVAVFPSTGGESFGIVLIEAMAAGKPVVLGANNPGYKTVLEDYPDVLFPVKNPLGLAYKLHVFLTNADERIRALAWQVEHVRQFDVAAVGPKLLKLYQDAKVSRLN